MLTKDFLQKQAKAVAQAKNDVSTRYIPVSISKGNKKMGYIFSLSTPPGFTCANCGCFKNGAGEIECYACYGQTGMWTAQLAYARNYWIYKMYPDRYWSEVANKAFFQQFFRYSVAGDIIDADYLKGMVKVANECHGTKFLAFTKKYDLVNRYIDENGELPANLQIVFSIWDNYPCNNKYNLPTSHLKYYDGTTTAGENAFHCPDDCTSCNKLGAGCWSMQKGQQVVFEQHGGKRKHVRNEH